MFKKLIGLEDLELATIGLSGGGEDNEKLLDHDEDDDEEFYYAKSQENEKSNTKNGKPEKSTLSQKFKSLTNTQISYLYLIIIVFPIYLFFEFHPELHFQDFTNNENEDFNGHFFNRSEKVEIGNLIYVAGDEIENFYFKNIVSRKKSGSNSTNDTNRLPENALKLTLLKTPTYYTNLMFANYASKSPIFDWFADESSVSKFYENPSKFYDENTLDSFRLKNPFYHQLFSKNSEGIQKFEFILLEEYFDESLVLMKESFLWDWDEIIYLKGSRDRFGKDMVDVDPSVDVDMKNTKLTKQINTWHNLDYEIYQTANSTFWRRAEEFGLDKLKSRVDTLSSRIIEKEIACGTKSKVSEEIKLYCERLLA